MGKDTVRGLNVGPVVKLIQFLARGLIANETETNEILEDDIEVPTEVEDILQSLFEGLQDKVSSFISSSSCLL